jgi:uncharacterized membrane protein YccC
MFVTKTSTPDFQRERDMRIAEVLQTARDAISALGRELAAWKPSAERALVGVNAVASVLLAVALAHMLHLSDAWWVAISSFAVMQTRFAASLERAIQRVLGTIIGALAGALAGPLIGERLWLFVPVLGVIAGVTVYRANTSSASYAWVLGGVTAVMVIYEAHELLAFNPTASFAMLRVVDVLIGVSASVVVAGAMYVSQQWYGQPRPGPSVAAAANADPTSLEPLRGRRRRAAVQAGVAVAIFAAFAHALKLPSLAQALVTIIAVLILPPSSAADLHKPIAVKMLQRVMGCLLAGAVGVILLPLLQGRAIPCLVALSAGVWAGCHVQTGQQGASYIGRQFTIAFIMVFVQDNGWSADPRVAMLRLAGIVGGIVILSCVMIVANQLTARSRLEI